MVSDSPVQIFVSYARNDDVPPHEDPTKNGFVTYLHHQLDFAFRDFGDPKPRFWRDVRRIDKADQFDTKIADAIEA